MGEAREPAAVARKAAKTTTGKTREDEDTAETRRAVETMKAIGEVVKAMEDAMGAKNKATNTTIDNGTKNLEDIVYATELNAGIKATGLANLARDLITACNYKNKNVKFELIQVESKVSSQIERPTLVIAIINNDLSKTQI